MKRIFIALCAIYPLFAFADIIATFDNGNIEDVTVVSVGADEVVYKQGGTQKTIASSQVDGVLYNDGRFITPPKKMAVSEASETTSDDPWAIDDAQELQTMIANGFLWQDKTYSAECRKAGKKEYYKVFKELYAPALQKAKANGLKQFDAVIQAQNEVLPKAMKAGNEAVRECNGGM